MDIGSRIDIRRPNRVLLPMPRQKRNSSSIQFPNNYRIRRRPVRSVKLHLLPVLNEIWIVEARSTDDSDLSLHGILLKHSDDIRFRARNMDSTQRSYPHDHEGCNQAEYETARKGHD